MASGEVTTIPMMLARALIAEAQAWFPRPTIPTATQDLWAAALADVRDLDPADVRTAIRTIATQTHDRWWALSIAEILDGSRLEMRKRQAAETRAAPRISAHAGLSAAQIRDEQARSSIALGLAREVVTKARPVMAEDDFTAEVWRRFHARRATTR